MSSSKGRHGPFSLIPGTAFQAQVPRLRIALRVEVDDLVGGLANGGEAAELLERAPRSQPRPSESQRSSLLDASFQRRAPFSEVSPIVR